LAKGEGQELNAEDERVEAPREWVWDGASPPAASPPQKIFKLLK